MADDRQTMHLPAGWRRVASKTRPGEHYYVSPSGPTWRAPNAGIMEPFKGEQAALDELLRPSSSSPRKPATPQHPSPASSPRRRKFTATSTSRADFVSHDPREALVERADRLSLFNPSCAPHPKAKARACNFTSVARADFVAHKDFKPEPRVHQWEMPGPMKPLGETSTTRADFVPHKAERQVVSRTRTPPKPQPFVFNSTQRASFNAAAAGADSPRRGGGDVTPQGSPRATSARRKQPADVPPGKPDITSQVFCDAGRAPPMPPQHSSPRHRPGSRGGSTAGLLGLTSPGARRTAQSQYRSSFVQSAEAPTNHALEARDYAHRAWVDGLNKSVPGQFDSQYRATYTESKDSAELLRTCHDVDSNVKSRAKAHNELSD